MIRFWGGRFSDRLQARRALNISSGALGGFSVLAAFANFGNSGLSAALPVLVLVSLPALILWKRRSVIASVWLFVFFILTVVATIVASTGQPERLAYLVFFFPALFAAWQAMQAARYLKSHPHASVTLAAQFD